MSTNPTRKRKAPPRPDLSHIAEPLRPLAEPCDGLILDPANARKHAAPNLEAIKGSLTVYGQRKPIVANRRTRTVIAGNGTLEAARALGWTHIAVVFTDDDPMTAAGFAIADNRTAELAEWDAEALGRLLQEVQVEDERLQQMFADLAEAEGVAPGDGEQPSAPEDFPEVDENVPTEHECPKCGYRWSGGAA
ncbi:MAG TPA: ParB N-terminal domain-containing protein [Gemmataceae bacterium]|nr:ParB N-terminal domain-containing protein [Gemmataceae bacterium]